MKDVIFIDLLGREKSQTIHENNLHKLLVEIYKSIRCFYKTYKQFLPTNNVEFFRLKENRYNFRGNYLLKLFDKYPSTKLQRRHSAE